MDRNDLISRSELKKCAIPCQIHNGALTDLCVPLYQIDNAPTVELTEEQAINKLHETGWLIRHDKEMTERPQGEWIMVKDEKWGDNVKCPFCGKELAGTDLNFCCKCGADMQQNKEPDKQITIEEYMQSLKGEKNERRR